jgi:outer membrane protein assembly factor BamB
MKRCLICVSLLLLAAAPALGDAGVLAASNGVHGGLVVHLGCGDGRLTAGLYAGESYCVEGLDADPALVEQARQHIRSLGLYGKVSVDAFDGAQLPYVDNMVNLLVADRLGRVPEEEVLRVLAPGGVALIDGRKRIKPRPSNIDEWTHALHDADNNAVADDEVVGPPRRLQWQGGPKWTRHHDRMSSVSAVVSSGGRVFYIIDEGSTASIFLPSDWALVARDAFNGKILWKRPIRDWYTPFIGLKSGPADAPRRLVAAEGRVYATLTLEGPVAAMDAVTGETIRTYPGTAGAEEILLSDGQLFVLAGPGSIGNGARSTRPAEARTVVALDAESGERLWQTSDVVASGTMAVDAKRVYYFNFDQKKAVGLDRAGGRTVWTSEPLPTPEKQTSFFTSRLVIADGVVLFAGGEYSGMTKSGGGETRNDTLTALSADTGKTLWTAEHPPSGYSSPENLFVIDGTVWCDASSNGNLDGTVVGMDLKTGEVKRRFPADQQNYWFHHRCYPGRATSNYLMTSRTGIEFVDLRKEHWDLNHWVRGACLYGIMPCNGLVYTPPAPCICYAESMLHSFNALAPAGSRGPVAAEESRLEKGPAYESLSTLNPQPSTTSDWPTYRGTNARSGATPTRVAAQLGAAWDAELGGRLTAATVADGKVFVASVDEHTLYALDAASGKRLWHFTAGGRIDSPPTFFDGRLLFGSADGRVYCLRADDGAVAWRFLAAPADRRILSYEQIESLWPVHGSLLVLDGEAWFVAGRSIFVDGGMRLYRLNARTGETVSMTVLDDRNPETGGDVQELVKWLNMPVGRPDVLSAGDGRVYMRSQAFDLEGKRLEMGPKTTGRQEGSIQTGAAPHLFCPTGFLDDSSFHRTYWLYGTTWGSGWNGYFVAGKYAPAGKIMCVDDDTAYVFGRQPEYYRWTLPMEFRLFAAAKQWTEPISPAAKKQGRRGQDELTGVKPVYRWNTTVPILVRAMALADKTLFIAGPPDTLDESTLKAGADLPSEAILDQEAALAGERGSVLRAVSAADGSTLFELEIGSAPVFDGMAVAAGRLYLSTVDGHVHCFGPR